MDTVKLILRSSPTVKDKFSDIKDILNVKLDSVNFTSLSASAKTELIIKQMRNSYRLHILTLYLMNKLLNQIEDKEDKQEFIQLVNEYLTLEE